MTKNKFAALALGATLSAFAAGCTSTTTNSNANGNTVPSNTGVVTNNNGNTNTAGVTATNTAANTSGDYDARYGRNYNYNVNRGDFDRTAADYGQSARNAGNRIGSGAEDAWIHFKVRGALATTNDLRDSTINADVDNNVVTLRGTVASAAQKNAAAKVAMGVDGVKSVTNQLQVSANDSVLTPGTGNANANGNGNTNRNANR